MSHGSKQLLSCEHGYPRQSCATCNDGTAVRHGHPVLSAADWRKHKAWVGAQHQAWSVDVNANRDEYEDPAARQVGGDHYTKRNIQPRDVIQEYELPWDAANAVKYVLRHRDKGGLQDIDKAIHYLQMYRDDLAKEAK